MGIFLFLLNREEKKHEYKKILVSVSYTHLDVYKRQREGYSCTLVNGRFVKPLDGACITKLAENHKLIAVMEENVLTGGYGMQVLSFAGEQSLDVKVLPLALPDDYVEHGSVDQLRKETGIDEETMVKKIMKAYNCLLYTSRCV